MKLAENVMNMQPSSTLAAMQQAQALKAQGIDVIDLSVGEPDFDTPEFIKEAAWHSLLRGETKYTSTAGVKSLQNGIVKFYREAFTADFSPKQIMATSGGKQAIFNAIVTLIEQGDDVLIPNPFWVSFPEMVRFVGGNPVFIDTEETEFILTAEQVEKAVTGETKLLILNSPSNPSGRVIPPAEFQKIIEFCADNRIYVISDECYLLFVYPPNEIFSAATLSPKLREFVCIAGSFSKTFAMTGWRVGYTIANETWTNAMLKVQSHSTSHPTSFAQVACAEALENWESSYKAISEMLAEYTKRREFFIPELNKLGFDCPMPEGAFYAYPNVRRFYNESIDNSYQFTQLLLNKAHIVTTAGEGFGTEGYVRFSYATSMERLYEAIERIKNVI